MDNNLKPISPNINFENIKKIDQDGVEYWEARELMVLLEYTKWSNFENVIEKAKSACTLSEQDVLDHFADISKPIKGGKGAIQSILDYKLSRYACYLIAQNGDSAKASIALAQTYFATQTRKQELFEALSDDEKRLLTRGEVIDHNKKLFKTAQDSGVRNFGKFNDAGYLGLYGLTNQQIQNKKQIGKDKILDRAGATELAANLFRITQTDEQLQSKLRQEGAIGQDRAVKTHFIVGGKVRKAIKDIGGTMPEELSAQEHIDEVKKRIGDQKHRKIGTSERQASIKLSKKI